MNTEVVQLDPTHLDPVVLRRAAGLLRAGRLVAFPTETVYGLGANALDPTAVRGIFWAKGRPATNPLIVHITDEAQLTKVVASWPPIAHQLAERFWPGPLTLVVPKNPVLPDEVTAGGSTVAVRHPAHPVAQALIQAADVPIAAPSANRSTEISPTRAEHVLKSLGGRIDLILDAGPCPAGIESTVVDLTEDCPRILRPGPITLPMLKATLGPISIIPFASEAPNAPARSPGQMARHYSPRTPLILVTAEQKDCVISNLRDERRNYISWKFPSDPAQAANQLYDVLHRLDEQGYEAILIELPPDTPDWVAVRDRLLRAAQQEQ